MKIFLNVILSSAMQNEGSRFFTSPCTRRYVASFRMTSLKGFTLIELLVAISIIGVLSSFLLANFIGVRERARDGIRKSDLRQIQSALELYRSDQGNYPASLTACGTRFEFGNPAVIYMQKIPCDPFTNTVYQYVPLDGNTKYSLTACLENENDSQKDGPANLPSPNPCDQSANFAYTLQNP